MHYKAQVIPIFGDYPEVSMSHDPENLTAKLIQISGGGSALHWSNGYLL